VHQVSLHTQGVENKRCHAVAYGTFATWFKVDIGDVQVVIHLPPGAGEHAMKAAEHLNAALQIAYPPKPTAEEADAELAKP
jgi:hypothetical protein